MKLLFSELRVLSSCCHLIFQLLPLRLITISISFITVISIILINQKMVNQLGLLYAKDQNTVWDLVVLCQPQVCSLMK